MARNGKRQAAKHRAVGYVRRSTDKQEQSIGDQKKAISDYAAEHRLRVQRFYVDDAVSGTSTVGRRAFQEMMADAQKSVRPFDWIVVYDVKRFGRVDNDEAGYYRHLLRTHGVDIRYVSENFNGDSTDDLLRPVKQWQARQESKDLSKVTIRGFLSKVENTDGKTGGWWMGGVPPFGYDLRYETGDGQFLFIVRYMPDGSKQLIDDGGQLTRTLARGESLTISRRDRCKLVPSSPERVTVIELDRLTVSQAEIKAVAAEALQFISGLEFTLRRGLPQEKLVALRQCVERVFIDKPSGHVTLQIRTVPAGNCLAAESVRLELVGDAVAVPCPVG